MLTLLDREKIREFLKNERKFQFFLIIIVGEIATFCLKSREIERIFAITASIDNH